MKKDRIRETALIVFIDAPRLALAGSPVWQVFVLTKALVLGSVDIGVVIWKMK
jgi:hypothetical protein